ncbi:hypothetical protein DASC09_043010 [Saccharomycopsis crataegensis]|uniref:Uncharacterized protein n=1 Tax=Saccharomycopsis crataegensis TaxID=43959 RepID=A0AAV5QQX8_9ASCO|nr:hypothetical protein DASC09_043010 [Saccharomycopsis crataegensis]
MIDCMERRTVSSYDEFDETILGHLKIYAPDLIIPEALYSAFQGTSLSNLKISPPLDESLKIYDGCHGFEIIRKLQDLAWVFVSFGVPLNLWSKLVFLYSPPRFKRRLRKRLSEKNSRSMTGIDYWLHSLITLTKNICFENHTNDLIGSTRLFCPTRGSCLKEGILELISLAEDLPVDIGLLNIKFRIAELCSQRSDSYSLKKVLDEKLLGVKSYCELREIIWKVFPDNVIY